ncbi:uncharacterized protein MONOS_10812 [Monocercomonoides exilis]|uniref:uncharacterized protein n=1 Tax=Monocercomonoides exilis TaxID=2049356 RepID=UPI003559FAAA|nr:hypothetical protein MONOS_10812 [Monocercomonoides exilis]|eukprot:MONOS_10812.1-p1 / transcript=MONOS_10812.1 / gene=MONOS_10812 / organism=Monocercomonoides_exilis_PA203 / gene_product=unspecified product / transcript_product=unspecified product / location=Mono_scaffold00506:39371-39952(+) / protein_length=194 / sequence_SO=supercontig / SO=protein_coding / is_pseudo=false
MSNNRVVFLSDACHESEQGFLHRATNDSHTKYTSLPTLALLAENTILVMGKEDSDTCELSLYLIMRATPFPPELVSSLTEQVEKVESLTEKELAGADEANEMHPPLVAVCWLNCSELMLVMVQLARERERAGEVAEEGTQLVGVAVEVISVMLEELNVRGAARDARWKMLELRRGSLRKMDSIMKKKNEQQKR